MDSHTMPIASCVSKKQKWHSSLLAFSPSLNGRIEPSFLHLHSPIRHRNVSRVKGHTSSSFMSIVHAQILCHKGVSKNGLHDLECQRAMETLCVVELDTLGLSVHVSKPFSRVVSLMARCAISLQPADRFGWRTAANIMFQAETPSTRPETIRLW
ncbi:hypothetical protein BDV97DRAFT_221794 [Delphinella strobiligena]|nr:hypothetical protein BDV97DRAFT_221794 [Delphinella strobiligena]